MVHLKRFKQSNFGGMSDGNEKNEAHVNFPLELDMANFVKGPSEFYPIKDGNLIYDCYAVSNH